MMSNINFEDQQKITGSKRAKKSPITPGISEVQPESGWLQLSFPIFENIYAICQCQKLSNLIIFIYFDSKSKYSNCFYFSILVPATIQSRIRSFAMFIFNNELLITFIQAPFQQTAVLHHDYKKKILHIFIIYISANSYERLFGMSESRPVRPVQLTLFNKQDHHKQWSSKQKKPVGQQLPGKWKNMAVELIFHKLRDKILTIEGLTDTSTVPSPGNVNSE